jgi:probable phosphoglycerate mutase
MTSEHYRKMTPASHPRSILKACLLTLVALSAYPSLPAPAEAGSASAYFLLRHAETVADGEDRALSEAGKERARALAGLLRDSGIEGIYSSNFSRTRGTVGPLAAVLGLEVTIYDPHRLERLAQTLKRRGGRQLVVGHSNTTPRLVELLGGDGGADIDEAGEFDRLYILTEGPENTMNTVVVRYGERSPEPAGDQSR